MTSDDSPGGYRNTDPDSAIEAALRLNATPLQRLILRVLRENRGPPMCCAQIYHYLEPLTVNELGYSLSVDSLSPRLCKMVEHRMIVCHGKAPRPNRHGRTRSQLVYSPIAPEVHAT